MSLQHFFLTKLNGSSRGGAAQKTGHFPLIGQTAPFERSFQLRDIHKTCHIQTEGFLSREIKHRGKYKEGSPSLGFRILFE